MDEQELVKIRADALSQCRKICQGEAHANERLPAKSIQALLSTNAFAEQVFVLSDHENKGWIQAGVWIELLKFNLGKYKNNVDNQELIMLLEGTCHMHINSEKGKIQKGDMVKIIGSEAVGNHIIKKIQEKKNVMSTSETDLTVNDFMDFITTITAPWSHIAISNEDLQSFVATFRKHAGSNQFLTREDFNKMLSTKNKYFTDRAFVIFDQNKDDKVGLDEYTETLRKLADNNTEEAIKFLFRVYDADSNGRLHQNELLEALKASMEENGMTFDAMELRDLTRAIWEDSGVGDSTTMGFEDFKQQLCRHQGLAEGLAKSITRWVIPPKNRTVQKKTSCCNMGGLLSTYKSNKILVNFMALYLLINICIYIWRFVVYYETRNYDGTYPNVMYMISRANGMCINFNSMMVLIFILRYTITLMRKMGLASKLPLDHHVYLHKFTGVLIFVQAWLHTIAHLINFGYNVQPHPTAFLSANKEVHFFDEQVEEIELLHNITIPDNCTLVDNCSALDEKLSELFSYMTWTLSMKPGIFGLISGIANPSGVALIAVLTIMVVCSMPFVRNSGHFEIFYFTHLLYSVYFVLFILHAPRPGFFIAVPLALFFAELLYRFVSVSTGNRGRAIVTAGIVLPSKVTSLVIQKPTKFNFTPGDWVFVKIPQIAIFEWHPFTISSAPEQKETFTLHIRGAGGWTNKLYSFFESEYQKQENGETDRKLSKFERFGRSFRQSIRQVVSGSPSGNNVRTTIELDDEVFSYPSEMPKSPSFLQPYSNLRRKPSIVTYGTNYSYTKKDVESPPPCRGKFKEQRATLMEPLKIYIDGPYGAPASNFFRAQHGVLIASGIGVTPFSSILQSLMLRYWHARRTCPNCNHKWSEDLSVPLEVKKVDFVWINRDQRSFEWFFQLLTQLELEQAEKGGMMERFLDIHMYITAALEKTDMRAVGLQLAMDLLYEKEKRDLITGLKARTKAGRPDWDKLFTDIKNQNKGEVTVFYCGNPQLGETVRKKSEQFGFQFRKEVF